MIVKCPSCQSRFSVDTSKMKNPLAKGRCSVCGHVFRLLDYAVDGIEAAALRDRLERERAEKEKSDLAGVLEGSGNTGTGRLREEIPPAPSTEETEMAVETGRKYKTAGTAGVNRGGEENIEVGKGIEETGGVWEDEWERGPDLQREWMKEGHPEEPQGEPEGLNREMPEQVAEVRDQEGKPPTSIDETLEPLEAPGKRSSLLPLLLVILIIVGLVGGVLYLYQSGELTSPNSITGRFIEKIVAIRGRSAMALFNVKSEIEPAQDGKFFVVRGFVENKQKTAVSYVPLRIKIYDRKNRVILTGDTIAGNVLKAEEISKMTVQDILNKYRRLMDNNRNSSGRLSPGRRLPFIFLFNFEKFPNKVAKTFHVEIMKIPR